jgi:tetratricopeptide (TPR) repeat protein
MMKGTRLKYIFIFSSASLLVLMLLLSKNAGISCDEVLHYDHSVSVYNYFASHGKDQSALNTPVTNLKYYGQSYDNSVTILTKWFNIGDIYGFRHLMSAIAGWLVILITAFFAIWIANYRAGIIVLLLFAVSPTFIGHSQNNLKDIPFALAYISGTFFTLKFLVSGRRSSFRDLIFLTASIAFSVSIRAGGLLSICYLFFFFMIFYLFKFLREGKIDKTEIRNKFLWICCITVVSWSLSILLWPYALQGPVKNVIESYRVMAHFPSTFRQIFEGKVEWSDFMPWYYLPKSMLITIPFLILAGLAFLVIHLKFKLKNEKTLLYALIIFSVLFPIVFVLYEKSNLYSSWRQFLFIYPGIVLLASTGYYRLFENLRSRYLKLGIVVVMALLSFHPIRFMLKNPQFYYLYYNQFTGGLKGAYSNYETDYYYVSQTEASKWLIDYLRKKDSQDKIKVKASYSVEWLFRNHPEIETSYFRYEERSQSDWDYAIVANRYISPLQLRNKTWPPENAIHIIYADKVPVGAVLERKSKEDFAGYIALNEGRSKEAIGHFEKALKLDDRDEMIFYNFAAALYNDGQKEKADSLLKRGLELNPDFEPILMYLGNIAKSQGRKDEAISYYGKVINVNRKYFEAYVGMAELLIDNDVERSRTLLKTCLTISPKYKPAIMALADTYRSSNPEIAKKYDELANTIE